LGAIGKQGGWLEGATNSTGGRHGLLDRSTDVLYQESLAALAGFRYNTFFSNLMQIDDVQLSFWIVQIVN
jgi:hypothetical protein